MQGHIENEPMDQNTELDQQSTSMDSLPPLSLKRLTLDYLEREPKYGLVLATVVMLLIAAGKGIIERWPAEGWIFVAMCATISAGIAWLDGLMLRMSQDRP